MKLSSALLISLLLNMAAHRPAGAQTLGQDACLESVKTHNALAEKAKSAIAPWIEALVEKTYEWNALIPETERDLIDEYVSLYRQTKSFKPVPPSSAEPFGSDLRKEELDQDYQETKHGLHQKLMAHAQSLGENASPSSAEVSFTIFDAILSQGHAILKSCIWMKGTKLNACVTYDLVTHKIQGTSPLDAINHPAAVFGVSGLQDRPILDGVDLERSYLLIKISCEKEIAGQAIPILGKYDFSGNPSSEIYSGYEDYSAPQLSEAELPAGEDPMHFDRKAFCLNRIAKHNQLVTTAQERVGPYIEQALGKLYLLYASLPREERNLLDAYESLYKENKSYDAEGVELRRNVAEVVRAKLLAYLEEFKKQNPWPKDPNASSTPTDVLVQEGHAVLKSCIWIKDSRLTACTSFDMTTRKTRGASALEAINHPAAVFGVPPASVFSEDDDFDLRSSFLTIKAYCSKYSPLATEILDRYDFPMAREPSPTILK